MERELFSKFVNYKTAHILQSPEWGDLRESEGHKVIRIVDEPFVYCQIVFHKLPKWFPSNQKYVGEVWRGPVFSDNISSEKANEFFQKVKDIGKEMGAVFIKFEPKIIKGDKLEEVFKQNCKLGEQIFVPCTSILDISKSEDEILSGIDKYTRKNIRKAERKEVKINIYSVPEEQKIAIKHVFKLLQETSSRAGFRIRSEKFYDKLIDIQSDLVKVYIIEAAVNGGIAASYVTMTMGNTIYTPYSGSSRAFSEYKANELINWELIKFAKSKGITTYDQWGVLPEETLKNDPMWGVTNFKMAFGGTRERYIGAYDMVISPKDYKLFGFAWSVRKMMKKVKKGFS